MPHAHTHNPPNSTPVHVCQCVVIVFVILACAVRDFLLKGMSRGFVIPNFESAEKLVEVW